MHGLMMDYQLTIPAILQRAAQLHASKAVVTRNPDRSIHRYNYGDSIARAKRLAAGLRHLGVSRGDRVATLCWNHYRHLECYFAIPAMGAVLHTLNLRLPPEDLAYIVNHAEDKVLIVDDSLLPLFAKFGATAQFSAVVVIGQVPEGSGFLDYEDLLNLGSNEETAFVEPDEREAAAMCYTSGTTGKPKGVLYSHRAIALHSLACGLAEALGLNERDVILPVVPMFHANAWGLPFTSALFGATLVLPGPRLDPTSLLELMQNERVTFAAGVPTIWLGLLQTLDADPNAYDLSTVHTLLVGGAAMPEAVIRAFEQRHQLRVVHAWGMTETAPLGAVALLHSGLDDATEEQRFAYRAKQGRAPAFIEMRARSADGVVPWDGQSMGELEVRGAWVAGGYYNAPEGADRFTDDGWFKTGDIVTLDQHGFMEIKDRSKDVIKSGGEWISSVALENALMAHPAVAEASVVGVPHVKWQERPLAAVVLKSGHAATAEELRAHLAERFPRWWLPDAYEFVDTIPKTSVGKFLKSALRERYHDRLLDVEVPSA